MKRRDNKKKRTKKGTMITSDFVEKCTNIDHEGDVES